MPVALGVGMAREYIFTLREGAKYERLLPELEKLAAVEILVQEDDHFLGLMEESAYDLHFRTKAGGPAVPQPLSLYVACVDADVQYRLAQR
jgi:hypothetical protein